MTAARGHTLGVAIEIAPPAREQLEAARSRYEARPGEMPPHVTLLPPIDVDVDAVPAILHHLEDAASSTRPFSMTMRGTATFRPLSPVVFVAIAEGLAECEALESRVRSGDMAVEARYPYHPHVTLAQDLADEDLDRAMAEMDGFEATMAVGSMRLYERREQRWAVVREFEFGPE